MEKKIYYAGIGSRKTPKWCLDLFVELGKRFAEEGCILRSGHADGADKAFEKGCDLVNGEKEIYLPWRGFESSDSPFIVRNPKAFEMAKYYHPNWFNLNQGAQKLHARNTHQILGNDLDTPSDFVICWTEGGKGSGGTGQAIRMAKNYKIPVIDFGSFKSLDEIPMEPYDYIISKIK